MESAAFKKLTEQLTEIVQYVRLAKMAFQDNLTGKGLKPMLTNDDAAKMLGVSKRTLQRMRSENRIDFIKIGNQCRYRNYSAPPMGMSNRLTVVLQQELH